MPVDAQAPAVVSSENIQELIPTDIPPSVFVGFNDAVAFYAADASAEWAEIDVSSLREHHDFTTIRVYAVDANGWSREVSVTKSGEGAEARFFVEPTDDTRYLAYANLSPRVKRTYDAICSISGVRLGLREFSESVPQICTQILCERDAYGPGRFFAENEEMTIHEERMRETGYPTEFFGGFGLSGNVCQKCLRDTSGPSLFYPTERCASDTYIPPVHPEFDEEVTWSPFYVESLIYDSHPKAYLRTTDQMQVYRTTGGPTPMRISQTSGRNESPDVSHATRSVVWHNVQSRSMIIDRLTGNESRVPAPQPTYTAQPRWNNMEAYKEQIVFPRYDGSKTELWVINKNGTGLRQLTERTQPVYEDTTGFEVWNGTTLLYIDSIERGSGIYAKSMTAAPSVKGTRIDACNHFAMAPVVSHDQTMVAYFCRLDKAPHEFVRVVEAGNWSNVLYEFEADFHAHGWSLLEFSGNDQYLFLERKEPGSGWYPPTSSIFRVKLDGTSPVRMTPNTTLDQHPTILPSYALSLE